MKKPETPQPETPKPETPKEENYESGGDFDTPINTSPEILLAPITAHRDDQLSDKTKTPLITDEDLVAKLCETVVSQNDKNPYATYETNDVDEIHTMLEELFVQSKLPQQQLFDAIHEYMNKAEQENDNEKAQLIWLTSIEFMNEIIRQTFANIKEKIKKTEINKLWFILISNFQLCWQKIISKEGKILFLEEMRALVEQTKDPNTKEGLFTAFILSIINTIKEESEEDDPFIKIPDEMRNSFPRANISEEDVPKEQYPERISPSILLPMDEDYIEVHEFLSSSDDNVAEIMLELIEQDFFTDEEWEKISCNDKEKYIEMCRNLPQTIAKKIDASTSTDNIDTSEEMAEIAKRAWNKIAFKRRLVWGEIIFSDKLLLPKEQ